MVNDVSSPVGRVVVRFAVVEWFHPKRWPACRVGVQVPRVRAVKKRRPGCGKPHANLITRGQWPNPDVSSVLRSPRAGDFGLRAEVERTPIFSLRENAIAQEPGLSYPGCRLCVSRLGASIGGQAPSAFPVEDSESGSVCGPITGDPDPGTLSPSRVVPVCNRDC